MNDDKTRLSAIMAAIEPIAKERDAYRAALELMIRSLDAGYMGDAYMEVSYKTVDQVRKVLRRYPKR